MTGEEDGVLHPGMASELAKLESEDRRREANGDAGRTSEAAGGPSAAGAIGLLVIVLLGPMAIVVALGALVAIAALVASGNARDRAATGPEAQDRWSVWRVAEHDAEERRQRAA